MFALKVHIKFFRWFEVVFGERRLCLLNENVRSGWNTEDTKMKVTPEMKIKERLDGNEQMVDAFRRISPQIPPGDPDYRPVNRSRPRELWGVKDDDPQVIFVDVISRIQRNENPWPSIMHGLTELRDYEDVLLLRHTFNSVPLREKFAKCGFASWAEERRASEWYIYFYRPTASDGVVAQPALATVNSSRAMATGA